jgi:glucokinase
MPPGNVIGVDLGGTKLLAGAVDSGLVVHHRAWRASRERDQAELLDDLVDAVDELRAAMDWNVDAVGFGIPCLIDQEQGRALMAVNLPIADLAFRDVMSERLGIPVYIDNDANVAALVEQRFGAAQGAENVVMLTIGTGIGGGVVVNGESYRGGSGAGVELGHMVIDMDGPRCQGNCPNRGCLEAVASGTAMIREAERIARENPGTPLAIELERRGTLPGPLITELAHDGDAGARQALEHVGRRLGVGISSLVNIFEPEVVVIGGGVIGAGDLLLEPAREEFRARVLPVLADRPIVPARFGEEAGMLGAACLALDGQVRRTTA